MNFTKMHGCGNDFIVTHEIPAGYVEQLAKAAPRLCDRRTGIGADGIILILPARSADCAMRVINADGSEAEMCGNGIRCLASYMRSKGLTNSPVIKVETGAGLITTSSAGEQVRVTMGNPVLDPARIPVDQAQGPVVMKDLVVDGRHFFVTAVSMGNPHAVIFVDSFSDEVVLDYGSRIEKHPFFPKRTNVEFVKVLSAAEMRMRVFERGVGETAACGTGACASVVAAILNKKTGNAVTAHLNGGDLFIEWDGDQAHPVYMTGPARDVYEGVISDTF